MKNIVFTLEFDDDSANSMANHYLEKGWALLHVGVKLIELLEGGYPYYNTAYVVGANRDQYDKYKTDLKNNISNELI